MLTLCITGEVGVNPAPHTKNLVPHPDFSHGQGRPFVFTPLKRSAGTCFSTAHLPFSSSSLIREVHCGKSTQSPAVMQKVRGRHDPPQPFELKNFSLFFPRFAPPAPKNSFRPIISVSSRPPTLSHTRSPCCTNLPATFFPPQAPPKSFSWFGTHGLRPCKTATKMSDTIRRPVCTMPILAPSSHHGTNCPAFSCHTSCIQ